MKAIVLAAGLGTRFRPLTDRWPKPAVPLLGQPLLRYTLAMLSRAGVTHLGLNTHHLASLMARVAEEEAARFGMELTLSDEPVIQGTGGGIRGLRRLVEDTDVFLVWNGDALFTPELGPLLEQHRSLDAAATLVLVAMPQGATYGTVEVDDAGRVRRIAGRGPGGEALTSWHFTGVHLLSPRVFSAMAESGPEDINRDVYPRLLAQGELVRGAVVDAPWRDVGTPRGYLSAQQALLSGDIPDVFGRASPFARAEGGGGIFRVQGAQLEGTAVPPVYVDEGAVVELGARLGPNVYVGKGVRVPAQSSVANATLFEASTPHGKLEDVLLLEGSALLA